MSGVASSIQSSDYTALAQDNRDLSQANRELAEENRDLTQQFADYERGTNSFAFLHILDMGTGNARAKIVHCGPNPARDAEIDIMRLAVFEDASIDWEARARMIRRPRPGDIYPDHNTALTNFDFPNWDNPERDVEKYRISIRVGGGSYEQILELHKESDGLWHQIYSVTQQTPEGNSLRQFHVDAGISDENAVRLRPLARGLSTCDLPDDVQPNVEANEAEVVPTATTP